MASSQTFYSITITNGNSNSAPSDGFVDNLKVEDYGLNLETTFFNGTIGAGSNTHLVVNSISAGFLSIGSYVAGAGVTSAYITGFIGPITEINITSGHAGLLYVKGDLFNISGGGTNAIGIVTAVGVGGKVIDIAIIGAGTSQGTGYSTAGGVTTSVNTGIGDGTLKVDITVLPTGATGTYVLSLGTVGGVGPVAMTATFGPPTSATYAACQAKRRGNVRYREIIDQLSMVSNAYVAEKANSTTPNTVSDATALTEATSFQFWIIVEHGDASLVTADETTPGIYLTGADCIQRCVARALIADVYRKIDVFDPTPMTSFGTYGATTSVPRFGIRIIPSEPGDNVLGLRIGAYSPSLADASGWVAANQVVF